MKATHKGTCQCCGAVQKLPNGRLAKHGYTVQWGFFSGICDGTGELPLEQSCDLINRYIDRAESRIAALCTEIVKLQQPATEPKAWIHQYIGGRCRREWQYLGIAADGTWFTHPDRLGKPERVALYGVYPKTVLECCTELNKHRIYDLNKQIRELDSYVEWQRKRILEWSPRELATI